MPFNVGDRVYLTRDLSYRRAGTSYRVYGIKDNLILVDGYWVRADRFSLNAPLVPPAPAIPRARTYDVYNYPGCCGAQIVFFGGNYIDLDRLKATMDKLVWPGYISVLNANQYNAGGGKMLEEAGWVLSFVTASNSGKEYPLYHYRFIKIGAYTPPVKVTEAPRAFGK